MKKETPKDDTTISIVLTESTASLLNLEVSPIESTARQCQGIVYPLRIVGQRASSKSKKHDIEGERISNSKAGSSTSNSGKTESDIAYLSKIPGRSNSSFDMGPDASEEVVGNFSETARQRLDMVRVYTRPLVATKSEVNQNNFTSSKNNVTAGAKESSVSVCDSGWINVCRICHGGDSMGDLLSPCRCRGSIALAHLQCLERWLKESANSHCELCQHHFQILREPKYSIPWSIFVFLRHPGEHCRELLLDLLGFLIYTPSAFASTYMLMLLCESIAKSNLQYSKNITTHLMAFSAIFGIAAIDFTYSSWLIVTIQRHTEAWKNWYRSNCELKLILPEWKQKPFKKKKTKTDNLEDLD